MMLLRRRIYKVDKPLVGDFLYSDGSWSTNRNAGKTCIGIVFYAGREGGSQNGYAVALEDASSAREYWSFSYEGSSMSYNDYIAGTTQTKSYSEATADMAAITNTRLIIEHYKEDLPVCPAFKAIHEYSASLVVGVIGNAGSWIMPSLGMLKSMHDNFDLLNQRITDTGGTALKSDKDYWSCTQYVPESDYSPRISYAWSWNFSESIVQAGGCFKSEKYYARGIIQF